MSILTLTATKAELYPSTRQRAPEVSGRIVIWALHSTAIQCPVLTGAHSPDGKTNRKTSVDKRDSPERPNANLEGGLWRTRSSRRPKKAQLDHLTDTKDEVMIEKKVDEHKERKERETLRPRAPGHARRKSDVAVPYRGRTPLVVIEDSHLPDYGVHNGHPRTRGNSSVDGRHGDGNGDTPVIVVEEHISRAHRSRSRDKRSESGRRNASSDSYDRQRPRSSSGGSERSVTRYRVVKKMDRIDSIPVEMDGKYRAPDQIATTSTTTV